MTPRAQRIAAVALPLAATVIGYLAFGIWGIAGGLAGALAAWAAGAVGGGMWVRSIAATIPPLAATGPTIVLVVALFAAILVWQRTNDARVFLFGALAYFVPLPGAASVGVVCGALVIALAGTRWIPAGVGLCGAAWVLDAGVGTALAAALGITLGMLARGMDEHPANASVARAFVAVGVILLCAPAVGGLAFAALGDLPADITLLAFAGLAIVLAGAILLLAHVGLAALRLTDITGRAVWSTMTWAMVIASPIVLTGGHGATAALLAFVPLMGTVAVAAAIGLRTVVRLSGHPVTGNS